MKEKIIALIILLMTAMGCSKEDASLVDNNEVLDCFCYEYDSKDSFYAIKEIYGVAPSGVFIDNKKTKIGWTLDSGVGNCDGNIFDGEGQEFWSNDEKIYSTLYFGKLTKIEDNIYKSDGDFCKRYDDSENYLGESIDFYIIFEDKKIYFVTEQISLDEMKNYKSDYYYLLSE